LPNTVNTETIKAEYKNGVLTVELPKSAKSKPKQIKVNVANGKNYKRGTKIAGLDGGPAGSAGLFLLFLESEKIAKCQDLTN
jgi:hypothetical protein